MEGRIIEQTPMRSAIARRMSDSKQQAPHFYVQTECAADALLSYLREINEAAPAVRITLTAALARAAAETLREHPRFNSLWTDEGLLEAERVNLGIAIAVQGGLVAPAVLDAGALDLAELARALRDLTERAHAHKLRPRELTEGTFTLSNLGAFPITAFTAIINPPQVATLATARPVVRCILVEGKAVAASFMTVTLSADHRVVDGADAARWLEQFRSLVEQPHALREAPLARRPTYDTKEPT